ncbi:MAG TPA: LppX_LprAFG lipoprotein [Acidimicrobiales bacterium]|nr:LppX_LprAFG lipoprotein [Acidimicrobiales bacterium]
MHPDPSGRPFRPTANHLTIPAGVVSALLLVSACGGSGASSSSQSLLQNAKKALDTTAGVHFTLQSSNVVAKGTVIKGGSGDLVRPDRLQGSLDLVVNGFQATVKVVAVGNTVEAQLPFAAAYTKINPSVFGLGNPSALLDPQKGLSSMLTAGTSSKVTGTERIGGELLDEVTTDVPGSAVPLLPNQNPAQPVVVVAAIDPANHQLRQATLTGPFTSATSNATFTVILTNYGEHVQITLPPVP